MVEQSSAGPIPSQAKSFPKPPTPPLPQKYLLLAGIARAPVGLSCSDEAQYQLVLIQRPSSPGTKEQLYSMFATPCADIEEL